MCIGDVGLLDIVMIKRSPFKLISAPDQAVLLEPLGVAHNAIEQLQVSGEVVLIIGCGPIGLMGLQVSKKMGATR